METLKSDVAKIRRLLKEENKAEIKRLKIVAKLDPWERSSWMGIVGY
jgi:hypothetical protein